MCYSSTLLDSTLRFLRNKNSHILLLVNHTIDITKLWARCCKVAILPWDSWPWWSESSGRSFIAIMSSAHKPQAASNKCSAHGEHYPCLHERVEGGKLPNHRIRSFDINSAIHKAIPNRPRDFSSLKIVGYRKKYSQCVLLNSKFTQHIQKIKPIHT